MKVAVIFVLLFATVLCRPAGKFSASSSESSEEVVKATSETPVTPDADATPATTSETDSVDSDDDDDDESDEDDDSSDSSESGEASTPAPTSAMVTEEPIVPSIVTDTDSGRGDSLGGYPGDYKSIIYMEDKSYLKAPSPYKSYEFAGTGKKMAYDMAHGNEVEKMTVYKALQVHSDLEEDTSTPEVESQGLDVSNDQPSLPEDESVTPSDASPSEATTSESDSSSATEEEEDEDESASSASDSTSTESEDEESSEEATATPGAADSDSDESESSESDSDEEAAAATEATTDMPVVITAK